MNTQANITVLVDIQSNAVEAHLRDPRTDAIELFGPLNEAQRQGLAIDAWGVGLRALTNAYRQAQEARLTEIGHELQSHLDKQLGAYLDKQQAVFTRELKSYFDPRDGKVAMRLERFVSDGGDLDAKMSRFLAPNHGDLAKTLAAQVGENSPMFKRLSPTDGQGVIATIESRLREALSDNQSRIARALDPLAEDGAVARFFRALRAEMEGASHDQAKQLAAVTKSLDANDPSSLMSRLTSDMQSMKLSLSESMNPKKPGSAMELVTTQLAALIGGLAEQQSKLDRDVREALVRHEERKRGLDKSPSGGLNFEDEVVRRARIATNGVAATVEATGNRGGHKGKVKVGDAVIRYTEESAYAGSALVIEAKRDASCTEVDALKELKEARENRKATAGLFVMAKSHASPSFPAFSRHGNDILVIWDDTDESTDGCLQGALFLGMALAGKSLRGPNQNEINALADLEDELGKEVTRINEMRRLTTMMRNNLTRLEDQIQAGDAAMNALASRAKATLTALDRAREAGKEPIRLSPSVKDTTPGLPSPSADPCVSLVAEPCVNIA
jgi:hypothetical protein